MSSPAWGVWIVQRGDSHMRGVLSTEVVLAIFIGLVMAIHGAAYAQVSESLEHDTAAAEKLFERRCTECHSIDTALSSRAYRDWRLGISQRHGKDAGWLSDEDARLIFLHLVVHLEPQIKTAVQAERVEPKPNWEIIICLISGFVTISLLVTTLTFGHSKTLRRKWFKGHSYFAIMTLTSAIIHGGYCSYLFILK
jgi:hypothetical protein